MGEKLGLMQVGDQERAVYRYIYGGVCSRLNVLRFLVICFIDIIDPPCVLGDD